MHNNKESSNSPPEQKDIDRLKQNFMAMSPDQQEWMIRYSYLSSVGDLVTKAMTQKMLDGLLSREKFWPLIDRQYELHMAKLKAEGMAKLRRLAEEQGVNLDDLSL